MARDDSVYPRRPQGPIRPLIMAEEAYPALEQAVIDARQSIWLAYRVFEPWTVLTSAAGQGIASDWIGLLRHKLREGVQVRLLLSDFDAIGATDLHERCWRCLRALAPLSEVGDFAALPALHMAGAGWLWRVALWPVGLAKMARLVRSLNRLPAEERAYRLASLPGLWTGMKHGPHAQIRMRVARTPGLYPATYHQKFAVIDGQFAMIGGLDINARRYDDLDHMRPSDQTWADVSVSTEGPVATDLARHFAECWSREAPRQLRRAARMAAEAPEGVSLPPMPTEEQAPQLPARRSDESRADADQSISASSYSPATIGKDPDDNRPPAELAGEVGDAPPEPGNVSVVTEGDEAQGEQITVDGPLGRAAQSGQQHRQPAPAAGQAEGGTAQVIRTITGLPGGRGLFRLAPRRMATEIELAHLELVAQAKSLIYLETQYLRSRGMVDALVRAGRRNRSLGLIVVLPAAPMEVAFEGRRTLADRFGEYLQVRAVRRIRRAYGTRAVLIAPLRPVPHRPHFTSTDDRAGAHDAEMIFVHSKVMTVDDHAAIVGSANMNGRSLRWDIELALRLDGGAGPPALRQRLFEHWLPKDPDPETLSLQTAVDAWRNIALDEAGRPPAQRQSFVLPYTVRRARRFGRPVPGVPEDFL